MLKQLLVIFCLTITVSGGAAPNLCDLRTVAVVGHNKLANAARQLLKEDMTHLRLVDSKEDADSFFVATQKPRHWGRMRSGHLILFDRETNVLWQASQFIGTGLYGKAFLKGARSLLRKFNKATKCSKESAR